MSSVKVKRPGRLMLDMAIDSLIKVKACPTPTTDGQRERCGGGEVVACQACWTNHLMWEQDMKEIVEPEEERHSRH